jgi:hypothetical protein
LENVVTEPRVRVPLVDWNTEERRRLRSLAAGAQVDIRWEGDAAVFVAADDEARLRELVTSIHPDGGEAPSTVDTVPTVATVSTVPSSPSMWAIDPTGRHEYQYWSGTMWTAHVADHGDRVQRLVLRALDAADNGLDVAPPGLFP